MASAIMPGSAAFVACPSMVETANQKSALPTVRCSHWSREVSPAARRDVGVRSFVGEVRLFQAVLCQLLEVRRGPRLHARGDFLGQQFDEEFGHVTPPPPPDGPGP